MPFGRGRAGMHDDQLHRGSAKRGGASGVAPLDASSLLPTANLPGHTDAKHSGAVANLLTALTPTFANWTTNPGTNANLVDELSNAVLTTSGVGAAGNNTIVYNLGDSRRRTLYMRTDIQASLYVSDDGTNWHALSDVKVSQNIYQATGIGKFQYIKGEWAGVVTVAYIKFRCYNLN